MYNNVFSVVDNMLTNANVETRKEKENVTFFVLNAITNYVIRVKEEPCEIQVYDTKKFLDLRWPQDFIYDLFLCWMQ